MKQESGPRMDPKATELFKKMSDYLGGLKAFSFLASFRDERVMPTGEKLEYESSSKVTLRRPNRLHTVRHGVLENLEFFYDGKTMTLFKGPNFYATVDAPANIDGMLDALLTRYGVDVPGSDLLFADAYSGMMPDVTDAKYLGTEDVGGTQARHISFRSPEVDWQIWIQDGDRPLPLKYVITTKGVAGEPSFGVRLMDWDLAPKATDAVFAFVPPAGAMKIEFKRPADVPAAPQR